MTDGTAPSPVPTKQRYQRWWVWALIGAAVVIGVAGRAASAGAEDWALVGSNFRVTGDSPIAHQFTPDVACDPAANQCLVVWGDSIGDRQVYGQLVSVDGSPVGSHFRISGEEAIVVPGQSPAVAYNPDVAEYLVVWSDERNNEHYGRDVYGRRVSAAGAPVGDDFMVNSESGQAYDEWVARHEGDPDVAYNVAAGEFLVVWADERDYETSGVDIYGQRVSGSGTKVGPELMVSGKNSKTATLDTPAVACAPVSGECLVVWSDGRAYNTRSSDTFAQRVSAVGSRVGYNFRVSGKNATSQERSPALVFNSTGGEYLVVWEDYRKGSTRGSDVYGQRVSVTGSRVGYNFRVSGKNALRGDHHPAVAYNPDVSQYLVVWDDWRKRLSSGDVFGQLVSGGAARIGFNFRISAKVPGSQEMAAVTHYTDTGQFMVVWHDFRDDGFRGANIYGQWVAP